MADLPANADFLVGNSDIKRDLLRRVFNRGFEVEAVADSETAILRSEKADVPILVEFEEAYLVLTVFVPTVPNSPELVAAANDLTSTGVSGAYWWPP